MENRDNYYYLGTDIFHVTESSPTLRGKARFLGWGNQDGADGVFISITRSLLDGCRLVVQTDSCLSYAENDKLKNAAKEFGVGLELVDIYALDDYNVEAIYEPIPGAKPRYIYVNKGRQMSPSNAYVLATDLNGEFCIDIFREDADGNRTRLWFAEFENK